MCVYERERDGVNKTKPIQLTLFLQDSSGLKLWKRRWFVLSNYCLYYYKGTQHFVHSDWTPVPPCFVHVYSVPHQTAEKNLYWAASRYRATKSSFARHENARTGSLPSRYLSCTEFISGNFKPLPNYLCNMCRRGCEDLVSYFDKTVQNQPFIRE